MTKFEYIVQPRDYRVPEIEFLNEMGRQGWDLVYISYLVEEAYYYFKRES